METVRLACEAMATRFEFVLHGERDPASLRAAGEEAIEEIHRIEAALSLYRESSEVAAINRDGGRGPVRVSPEVFRLVETALRLSEATGGAFDVTVGPLLRVWGLMGGSGPGQVPSADALQAVRACVGARQVVLDEADFRVGFRRPGVLLDLGSIGKGYALDRAAERLRDSGVAHALLHGGTSTVVAVGAPPGDSGWRVAIDPPSVPPAPTASAPAEPLAVVALKDESLSVSAVWGKGFEAGGRYYGHVMDPRKGEPVAGTLLAAMILPSATESDAISTALLVRGAEMVEALRRVDARWRCLVAEADPSPGGYRVVSNGISARAS